MQEIWIDIPKYENHYKVSNTGKVMSFKTRKPKILKQYLDQQGRFRVALRRYERTKYFYVHRLVYFAFNNQKLDSRKYIIHQDYDVKNNNLENLMEVNDLETASKHYKEFGQWNQAKSL